MIKRYAIIENGTVANVALAGAPLADNWIATETAGPGWTYANGEFTPPEPPAPTIPDFQRGIERHIDDTARARDYANAVSCASYVNSTVPQWAAEAAAFVAWRDAVWSAVFAGMGEADPETPPAPSEIIAELPHIKWPA